MAKAALETSPLFIATQDARVVSEDLLAVLMHVRSAKRWVCKAESKGGKAAHASIHDAETILERVLRTIGSDRKI